MITKLNNSNTKLNNGELKMADTTMYDEVELKLEKMRDALFENEHGFLSLVYNKDGTIKGIRPHIPDMVFAVLAFPELAECFVENNFDYTQHLVKPPLAGHTDYKIFNQYSYPRAIHDLQVSRLVSLFDRLGFLLPRAPRAKAIVRKVIEKVCARNPVNPILDLATKVKWDGKDRLGEYIFKAIGADDTPITRLISAKFAVAALRRAIWPSTYKFESILYLCGPNDIGKTAFCVDLFGSKYYLGNLGNVERKKTLHSLRGNWCAEDRGAKVFSKADDYVIKTFTGWHRNRTVFVSTTDKEGAIENVLCQDRIMFIKGEGARHPNWEEDYILKNRLQIWAQAYQYLDDENFSTEFTYEEKRELIEVQKNHYKPSYSSIRLKAHVEGIVKGTAVLSQKHAYRIIRRRIPDTDKYQLIIDYGYLLWWLHENRLTKLDDSSQDMVREVMEQCGFERFRTGSDGGSWAREVQCP